MTVNGQTQTFEFDSGYALFVPAAGANVGGVRDGETFAINGVVFEFDSDGTVAAGNQAIPLIVDTGLQIPAAGGGIGGITDGQRLTINDGAGGPNVVFEFDRDRTVTAGSRAIDITNVELLVPVSGSGLNGVADGHTFAINEGFGGPDVVFEFDINNNVAPGNRPIGISDRSTQDEVASAIVNALVLSGIGLNPVNRGGGVIRLGLFRHTVDTAGVSHARTQHRRRDAERNRGPARRLDRQFGSGVWWPAMPARASCASEAPRTWSIPPTRPACRA